MGQAIVVLLLFHLMDYCLQGVHVISPSLLCGILRYILYLKCLLFIVVRQGEDIPAAILCCEVDDMKEPILLSITGHVHGLSIHYSLVDSPDDQE